MKDLKFSIFDLFSYALPGGVVMGSLLFISSEIKNIQDLVNAVSKIDIGLGIVSVFSAYIIGNAIDSVGSWIFNNIGMKIWGDTSDEKRQIPAGKQRALVRNYSPQNNTYIQQWKVVKTMSHNLSFSFLLLGIIVTSKVFFVSESRVLEMIILLIISFLFSFIFLNRAHVFDKWHYQGLTNIVDSLNLEERAKRDFDDNKMP